MVKGYLRLRTSTALETYLFLRTSETPSLGSFSLASSRNRTSATRSLVADLWRLPTGICWRGGRSRLHPRSRRSRCRCGPEEAVRSLFPLSPGVSTGNALDTLDRRFLRGSPLESLKDLPDLLVFNDEAHHIHDMKKAGELAEVEWQKSLNEIAATKGDRFIQVDFSATPYNQTGSGKNQGKTVFPTHCCRL